MGYDIGNVLAHLVLNYLTHYAHTPNAGERAAYQAYLLDTTRDVWEESLAEIMEKAKAHRAAHKVTT